jgi:acylaminoacyl-peptidase
MHPDGSNRRILASIDRSVDSPVWSQFHQGFLFTYTDQGNSKLALARLDGTVQKLADNLGSNAAGRPYTRGGPVSVAGNGTIAFCITTPEHPGDLARLVTGRPVERLTHLNQDLLGHKKLGQVRELRCQSSCDGRDIQGWVITPPDFDPAGKYPMILEIHGGPFSAYGDVFTAELQLMASAGYVVLYTNPRGSTSYGQEFANQIHHNYPGQDFDDLMSCVDALIAEGYVDEDRLYVTGGSGGGVLTAWIVGNTNRFKAAVVAKPVINWYSFALTSDGYSSYYKYWFPGFPWDNVEHYMQRSPISRVGQVETPTMLLTGEEDLRTPMAESEQFYQALKLRKIDTALVRVPGASHGIAARPSHLLAKVAYILKWFETYP